MIPYIDYTHYYYLDYINTPYAIRETSSRIELLNPRLQPIVRQLLSDASRRGIPLTITSTTRTIKGQAEIYAQGRTAPGDIISYAPPLVSWHNYGLAFDVAIMKNNQPDWSVFPDVNGNGKNDWYELAWLGKRLGLQWGGDFAEFADLPHFEFHPYQDEYEALWRISHGYDPLKA